MVRAYQEVEPLTIGELWAIAISLRILLVENLRRLAERIVRSRADRQQADELADRLLGLGDERAGATPRAALAGVARAAARPPARVQLFQRLRDQDPAETPALRWLEELVAARGHDGRGDRPRRAPAPGDDERDGPQRDHEHAPDLVVRLGRVRRERQPGRRRASGGQRVRGDGLRDARPLPPRDRGAWPAGRARRRSRSPTTARRPWRARRRATAPAPTDARRPPRLGAAQRRRTLATA